mgnify:FL=1
MYLFRQAINHIHYLLAYFICRFHGCSLRINTDNRFSITLTQMYPLVWEIDFHTVYVVYLFILIQFLYLANSVHIRFRSQINAILGNEIRRISSTQFTDFFLRVPNGSGIKQFPPMHHVRNGFQDRLLHHFLHLQSLHESLSSW